MRKTGMIFLVLLAAGLAAYAAGLHGAYFSDDYQFVFDRARTSPLRFFTQPLETNAFYRPLQASFLWLVQSRFGMNTLPIHVVQVGTHAALAALVFSFLTAAGFTRTQAWLGALFMLLSQASVLAVESNDTLSQTGSALFGYLSLALFWRSRGTTTAQGNDRAFGLSLACFALALWSKESGVSFLLMMTLIVGIDVFSRKIQQDRLRAMARLLPYVLVTVAYLFVRSRAGGLQPAGGESGYTFHLGANVLVNTALCLFSALSPVSTVTLFTAAKSGSAAALAPAAATVALFLLLVAAGAWAVRDRARVLLLAGTLFVLALIPVILLPRVSELYGYNSMPPVAALCGIALGGALQALGKRSRAAQAGFAALVLGALVLNLVSVQSKIGFMVKNGERATALYAQIEPFLAQIPRDGKLVLLNPPQNPPDRDPDYSVYKMRGFSVLEFGNHFNQLAGRSDFTVEILDALPPGDPGRRLVLALGESGRVERRAL